ncbi:hypothetical protein AWC38_SpisGene14570 [Stylophora pistillata]|uniref:Uncharacterized protein n=1 Tax=Stylophora pistillata TaxID=50429 RepID=A0A2B4RWK9_STYPI|nr:hypothetical protein AWC38_SpisGene14570 [Stylophora pistillata]
MECGRNLPYVTFVVLNVEWHIDSDLWWKSESSLHKRQSLRNREKGMEFLTRILEPEAQIEDLAEEIKNLKSQLAKKDDDESTSAARQAERDQRSPTNEQADFQSVQTRAEAELRQLSAHLAQDIDIVHRVPLRSAGNLLKPIICKFRRRLAKEAVMARRKDACKPNPINLGLPDQTSLSSVRLFNHLTPKMQNVFSEAKTFKTNCHFEFCRAKNLFVYLPKDRDSRVLKIKDVEDLQKLLR